MNMASLLRALIIIIIIGGVIIIIWFPKPDPPPCLVCGSNGLRLLGIAETVLGIVTLGLFNKFTNGNRTK